LYTILREGFKVLLIIERQAKGIARLSGLSVYKAKIVCEPFLCWVRLQDEEDQIMTTLNNIQETFKLPLPPEMSEVQEMEIYVRFMRHLRNVPNSRAEIKVLSAIQFTADMLVCSDAHVAKALVDLGLRAPRAAFPAEFLSFADRCLMRSGWEVGGPNIALLELQKFWRSIGEDKFAAFQGKFDFFVSEEEVFV
jgi:hypothetical protein